MAAQIVELLIYALLLVSVTYVCYTLFDQFRAAAEDMHAKRLKEEDATLAELYIQLSPEAFFLNRLAIGAMCFLLSVGAAGVTVAAVLGLVGFVVPQLLLKRLKKKRVKKVERQLVEGLELLSNGLKSGLTLPQAIELLVREFPPPISQEFALVLAETRLGVELAEALERMAERLTSSIVYILASGITITKQCGGDLTQIFNNIAATIREQANIEGKLDAVTAQGRFQGLVLGLMPFILVIILYFIDPAHVETLFSYNFGRWALVCVVVMVAVAQLWIKKLLAIDV